MKPQTLKRPGITQTLKTQALANSKQKNEPYGSILFLPGGSERIRTSETLLPTRFRVVRLQPLGHASTSYLIIFKSPFKPDKTKSLRWAFSCCLSAINK